MITYTKVNKKNLNFLYNSERGNLYFRRRKYGDKGTYEVADCFSEEDLAQALSARTIDLIFIPGPSLGTNVEVD